MKQYLSLRASAGTGKTFSLSARYISLLLRGSKASEILCLTFTNKAANEMKQRILSTILNFEDPKNEPFVMAICQNLGISASEAKIRKNEILNDFINSQINIFTIDKFVNMVLKEFCGYAQIADNYEIKKINRDFFIYHFLTSLDVERLDFLINFIYNEGKSLDALFDIFKSLEEKNEFFRPSAVEINTIFELKNLILKVALKLKAIVSDSPNVSSSAKKAVDFDDFESFIQKSKTWLLKNSFAEYSYFRNIKNGDIESIFSDLKGFCANYFKLVSQNNLWQIFEIYNDYIIFKQKFHEDYGQFEFNDITNLVYKLLNHGIDKEFLQFRLDMKFNHLLIDEFQDTSLIQYKILKPLISEIVSGQSYEYKTFFYVGDTKQAIYRFRNGKKELFDSLQNEFKNIVSEELNVNFRSSQNIVSFCNEIFSNLIGFEYSKQLANSKSQGFVRVENLSENWLDSLLRSVNWLLEQNIHPNDIAILTFTNDEVGQILNHFRQFAPQISLNTETTNLLINQTSPKAIINILKYFYFEDEIYLKNFNALCKVPLQNRLEIEKNLQDLSSLSVKIAKEFDIFDDDFKAFLPIISSFSDIVDFVYDVDFCDAISNNSQRDGIAAMTIFKSKGLEFQNVIVLDRTKKANNFSNPILFDYDGIRLNHIFYSIAGLEEFDESFAKAKENEQCLKQNDLLNVLYVALTRAKTNMLILKLEKNSQFDKLDLVPQERGMLEIFGETLNEVVYEDCKTPPFKIPKQNAKSSRNDNKNDLQSEYFGIATHFILEQIPSFEVSFLDELLEIAKFKFFGLLDDEQFDLIRKKIEALICDEKFLLLTGNAKTILKEQPLVFENELKIVDLYLDFDNFGVVIDYKTGQKNDENSAQVVQYKKALSKILDKKIIAFLVYLHDFPEFLEV